MPVDIADSLQQAMVGRALAYGVLIWIVVAIAIGLFASEVKKRRFWTWVILSLVSGPIAWYLALFRVGVAIPDNLRIICPRCGKATRSDTPRCLQCKALLDSTSRDRAADLGRQAASMLFTARRMFGTARRVADEAASRRPSRANSRREPPPAD